MRSAWTMVGAGVLAVCCVAWVVMISPGETAAPKVDEMASVKRPVAPAAAGGGKKPECRRVRFEYKCKPPQKGLRAMAARTNVTMGEMWNGTLWGNIYQPVSMGFIPPFSSASLSALGCTASIALVGSIEFTYPYRPADISDDDWAALLAWATAAGARQYDQCVGMNWSLSVGAPSASDTCIAATNGWVVRDDPVPPEPTVYWYGATQLEAPVSLTVSGLYLKRSRTATTYDDRETMDWSDLNAVDTWYADENSTVTVTATGPGGISLSATGSLGYTAGQEVEIGSTFQLVAGIALNSAPTANTPYGRISGLQWGSTAIDTSNIDLYNPGDTGDIPSESISPWSRTQSGNNCYHVYDIGNGFAIEHLQGTESDESIACIWSAPNLLTVTAVDGMHDADGGQYDPRIEYESPIIEWVQVGGVWTSRALKFTDTIQVVEAPSNYEFEHEYSRISNVPIYVRVTEDWRDANGEDVGNDVPGGDGERYNDRRCGICLPGLAATDCVGDPWWSSGIGLSHVAELDINDTAGVARRASWWLGGAGVDIDPDDNDVWTVAAGASSPAVSRSWRTRYWHRMERLQEKADDPEKAHLAEWAIMLKANIPLAEILDDPDWWEEPLVQVSGAGSSVNGDYQEFGSAGGEQQYLNGTTYVRYNRELTRWEIVQSGSVLYVAATLTGTWSVVNGSSPAPEVVVYRPTEYGLGSMLYEDIYNWVNYRYLHMQLRSPVDGTVRVTVEYSVPTVADSCYTNFTYRFGDWAEEFGGWEYSRSSYTMSFDVPVTAGSGWYLIDMMLNREHQVPVDERRVQVVDSIAIALPENTTEGDLEWELQALKLVEDPGEAGRPEPDHHVVMRYKPSWSWIDPNWKDDSEDAEHAEENWFGFGAMVDGKPALQIDYGYLNSMGKTGEEIGLLYIQFAQHNPLSEATGRIDSAKSLARWHNELDWQEGFELTWPGNGPQESIYNQDQDQAQVDGNLYWWDLWQSDEGVDWSDVPLALCTGTWQMAAGVSYDMRFYKFPRGRVHGIAVNETFTECLRGQAAIVALYGSEDGAAWQLLETLDTDAHGRYQSTPVREKDWRYRIGTGGDILHVVNRSYTHCGWASGAPAGGHDPFLTRDIFGTVWLATAYQGEVQVYYVHTLAPDPMPAPVRVSNPFPSDDYERPSMCCCADGSLLVAATRDGHTRFSRSRNGGDDWDLVSMPNMGQNLGLGTIWYRHGEVYLCGIEGDEIKLRVSSRSDLDAEELVMTPTAVTELVVCSGQGAGVRSAVTVQSTGAVIVAVGATPDVEFYRCRSYVQGFVAV